MKAWWVGEAKQPEMVAWLERNVMKGSPDRSRFVSDLCSDLAWQFCLLMSPAFVSKSKNAVAEPVLDGLAVAMGSFPEYAVSTTVAKSLLTGIVEEFPCMLNRLREEGRKDPFLRYFTSDKLRVLLTTSPLREGYFRPLISIAAIIVAALKTADGGHFDRQIRQFVEDNSRMAGLSAIDLSETLEQAAQLLMSIDFGDCEVGRSRDVIRILREPISNNPSSGVKSEKIAQPAGNAPAVEQESEFEAIISELTDMIGLDAVKKEIISLTNFIKVQRLRAARNLKPSSISLHLVFSGSPGTGKTTVARIVAKIYKALGVLSSGHLIETDRSGLIVGYVGQTATNTKKVVESALDGVLFIDEAYSLVKDAAWDFGPEAIETLLKLMEDYRERLVVIVAGYTEPMAGFIASNPGLQSRFTRKIEFHDYTADEMLQIFDKRAVDSNFRLTDDAAVALRGYFSHFEGDEGFGNGRGVRNIFENATVRHADRIASIANPSDSDLTVLTKADVCSPILNDCKVSVQQETTIKPSRDSFDNVQPLYESEFSADDRVFHQKFGYGRVVSIDGSKMLVKFERAGEKRVIDSFVERV